MNTASVRDLRYRFPEVERLLRSGETVEITKRGRLVGRLSPPGNGVDRAEIKVPDVLGRLRAIYGNKMLKVSNAELLGQERERF